MNHPDERWTAPIGLDIDLVRWSQILAEGFHNDADVRWLTSPGGLLQVCRRSSPEALHDLVTDPDLDILLADLDDRLPAFPGPLPSDRARALITLAGLPPDRPLPDTVSWAFAPARAEVAGDDGPGRFVTGPVDQLRSHLACLPTVAGPSVSVPVAVSHHSHGDVVLITLRLSQEPGVGPDLVAAPFQRLDLALARAVADAAAGLALEGGVRFAMVSRRTHQPLDAVGGPSVGLGAALALRRLADPLSVPLDPDWVFTGQVDRQRRVHSLVGSDGSSEYRAKLAALPRGGTLVYPARDRTEVERAAAADGLNGLRLEAVTTVGEAERLAERHLDGRRAYQRALDRGSAPSRLAALVAAVSLLALVGVLALSGSSWFRAHHRSVALRAEAAGGAPVTITVFSTPDQPAHQFQLDATEVSNQRYAACVAAGVCPQPAAGQAMSISDPAHGDYPVTGVTAASAEIFCGYGHGADWGLPTHQQYVETILDDRAEFPHGDPAADPAGAIAELPPTIQPVPTSRSLSHVTGNVAEWTRTKCADRCVDLTSVAANPTASLRVFGLSFAVVSLREPPEPDWITGDSSSNFVFNADAAVPRIGFRCASRPVPVTSG